MNKDDPCRLDLLNPREIIQHFRDLYNLHNLLKNGLDYEENKFVALLKSMGWGNEKISEFKLIAAQTTRYEQFLPSTHEGKRG